MRLSDLQDYDYKQLESYWFRFKELAATEETNPTKKRNIDNIKKTIEALYNESDELMREFIECGYFNAVTKEIDLKYMADELGISTFKLKHMRKGLMRETAKLIGWV